MNRELTRELLLLVDAVSDGLLSFEVTRIYLPNIETQTLNNHIYQIVESDLVRMQRDRVIGLSSGGKEFLS